MLCKILCHNVCCLIQSIYELGTGSPCERTEYFAASKSVSLCPVLSTINTPAATLCPTRTSPSMLTVSVYSKTATGAGRLLTRINSIETDSLTAFPHPEKPALHK